MIVFGINTKEKISFSADKLQSGCEELAEVLNKPIRTQR